ncbi:MAG: efflux RND transporter periplasmic adaptor subunit [Moraxellaceae bacterium]|nr:efflux RND transporter periplasmic adaptor subunit [Moraxellaceae bacterium]
MMRLIFSGLLASTVLLTACSNGSDATGAAIRPVKITVVGEDHGLNSRRFVGRVDALSTVDLSFQVPGKVTQLSVNEGSIVPKGQLIAALDPRDFNLALREAQTQFSQAQRNLSRGRELFDQGVISQVDVEQLQTQFDLANVARDNARQNLAYTNIRAPFNALVTRRLIDPFTNVAPNMVVVRVQDVTDLRVHINVPEHLIQYLNQKADLKAQALFSQLPGQPMPLTYIEHQTQPDPVAQTYQVSFALPRLNNKAILPGMSLTVELALADLPTAAASFDLPISAIDSRQADRVVVWVYDEKTQVVTAQKVRLGPFTGDRVQVLEGLSGGEQIVSAGVNFLHDGMRVKPFTSL